ncbi:MAG: universal stress protein [Deltaproteobacteria bacterium]|nr:universal stress protein [Deltaproteobacteria bacterium]MBN2845295.1 universal stress protein [Deltaproteobacteria bacterium]
MSEKILIPLDGSIFGEAALRYIEKRLSRLEEEKKTEVVLLQVITTLAHIVPSGEAAVKVPYTESELEQIKKQSIDYLNEAGEDLKSKGVVVKCEVKFGTSSANEIIKAEEEFGADLVAMSTHGRHGLSRWAFGSVTDKVLREGKVPVLLVRIPKKAE